LYWGKTNMMLRLCEGSKSGTSSAEAALKMLALRRD
jgi:hypothetical protein